MFNFHDIATALRFCVIAFLLCVPLTSQALPADNNHVALADRPTETRPANGEECRSPFDANRRVAPRNSHCFADCMSVFRSCKAACSNQWCVILCSTNHSFCIYGCNAAP